jgi:hypothetical protein
VAVPSVITDLSATAASNSPAGGDAVFPDLDNYLRAHASLIRYGDTKAANVASATNIDLGAAVGRVVDVTGTTTVASFGTVSEGVWRIVRFTGALTLTYNATSMILPGAASITTAAGDCAIAVSLGSGNWVVTHFQRAAGDVGFRVLSSASLAGGFGTFATYGTTSYNYGSAMNATTGVFTVPRTGWYEFSGTASSVATGAMDTDVKIEADGVPLHITSLQGSATITRVNVSTGPVYLTTGQEVKFAISNTTNMSSVVATYFNGAFIRA